MSVSKTRCMFVLALLMLLQTLAATAQSPVYYVDVQRPDDSGDGLSWATARRTIQSAISTTSTAHQVWVRGGTYREALTMRSGVALYGGFGGAETSLAQRDAAAHGTTLDASTARGGQPAYHAVTLSGVTSTTLDGLTICGGNNSSVAVDSGNGGGIYALNADKSNTISGCLVTSNTALYMGGGIALDHSSLVLSDCLVTNNATMNDGGGGILCWYGSPTLTRCTSNRNWSTTNAGGLKCYNATVTASECKFNGNTSSGIYTSGSSLTLLTSEVNGNQGGGACLTTTAVFMTSCTLCGNFGSPNGGGALLGSCSGSVSGCTFMNNTASSGGGVYCSGSISISKCLIAGNRSTGTGGGIYIGSSSTTISGCLIVGNSCQSTSYGGGGIYISSPYTPIITNCTISGNTAPYFGGGCYSRLGGSLINCILSGNKATRMGGSVYCEGTTQAFTLTNCTIDSNDAGQGGGVYCPSLSFSSYYPTLTNCILSNNTASAIYEAAYAPGMKFNACLFYGNPGGDYCDGKHGGFSGAATIMKNVTNAKLINESWPNYAKDAAGATTGTWSAAPVYDVANNLTILTNGAANLAPGALAGRLINTDSRQRLQTLVTSNTATRLWVVGDVRSFASSGSTYQMMDYHLLDGSGGIDRGIVAGAPTTDLEGEPRPGADGLVDMGPYESPAAYVMRDMLKPQSAALALSPLITSTTFNISFSVSDVDGVFHHAQIIYRRSGGPWTLYGDSFTTTPLAFDSTQTGGDGQYEFYTRAVDDSGNVEDAPTLPDTQTWVVSRFGAPWVYVDCAATGTGLGGGWENACTSIMLALRIAKAYGVPEVWVARGRYNEAITMPSGVALYGGFEGGGGVFETKLSQRDPARNATILDGSKANGGQAAYTVVTMDNIANACLDGFTICGGNNQIPKGGTGYGGGIYCHKLDCGNTIANCTITGNLAAPSGSGIYCDAASPLIRNCTISLNLGSEELSFNANSAPSVMDCSIHGNLGVGIGSRQSSPRISRCTISANSGVYGGGIYLIASQATLEDCSVCGNKTSYGGAIHCDTSQVTLNRCLLSGNKASTQGGALNLVSNSTATLTNCVLSGNTANNAEMIYTTRSALSLINCTIDGNTAPYVWDAVYGIQIVDGPAPVIRGSIFSHNLNYVIRCQSAASVPILTNNLFFANLQGDYCDPARKVYTGPDSLNLNVPGAVNCLGGDTRFAKGRTGQWTAAAVYDATAKTTLLSDAGAALTPGALRGRLINPDTSQLFQALVLDNTTTTVLVAGDLSTVAHLNDKWTVVDYHLRNGSAALDQLDPAQAPADDIDSDARPGADGRADLGADEANPGFTSSVESIVPQSAVVLGANLSTDPVLAVPFRVSDPLNDPIHSVRLFYRRNGGAWMQYPDAATTYTVTASPIRFDSALTGGDGRYAFYSLATDDDGKVEPAKNNPEATVLFVTQKLPRLFVNQAAVGIGTGATWTDACTSISQALAIAHNLAIPEVWVARGVYMEALVPPDGIALYGGFAGNELQLDDRCTTANPTVIDPRKKAGDTTSGRPLTLTGRTPFRIDGFTLRGGVAKGGHGGAIYCSDSSGTIAHCVVTGNQSTRLAGMGGEGGGIYLLRSRVLVDACTITRNQGYFGGGIRCAQSTATLNQCLVNGNTAYQGGGLHNAPASTTPVSLDRCLIQANVTTDTGGGVYCAAGAAARFTNCLLTGNGAKDGAGFMIDASSPTLVHCTIADNRASTTVLCGGGVTCQNGATPLIRNTIIANNTGSGLDVASGRPILDGAMIGGNTNAQIYGSVTAQGLGTNMNIPVFAAAKLNGLYTAPPAYNAQTGVTSLTCNVNLGNPGSLAGQVLTVDTARKTLAVVMDNTSTTMLAAGDWSSAVKAGTPWQFNNYRQGLNSRGIDTGSPAGEGRDLDGNPRPVDIRLHGAERTGTEYDLGAYETQSIQCTLNTRMATGNPGQLLISPDLGVYDVGATVTLTVQPSANYHFLKWIGSITTSQTTSNPLQVLINGNKTIYAYTARDLGTVTIDASNMATTWSLVDGDGQIHTGLSNMTLPYLPSGTITLTWGTVAGYDLVGPRVTSQTLARDGSITFTSDFRIFTGTVNISVVPPSTAWSLYDGIGNPHSGTGNIRLTDVAVGTVLLYWGTPKGYRTPSPVTVSRTLAKGQEIFISEVLDPTSVTPSPARHAFNKVLNYLLGLITDPAGLDLSRDGRIDAADLLASVNSLSPPAPAIPSPSDGAVLSTTTVTLNWAACARAQSYKVYFWKSGEAKGSTPTAILTTPSYGLEAKLVTAGTRYYWQVEAINGSEITAGPAWTFRITSPAP